MRARSKAYGRDHRYQIITVSERIISVNIGRWIRLHTRLKVIGGMSNDSRGHLHLIRVKREYVQKEW